jgi:hypothetical protein
VKNQEKDRNRAYHRESLLNGNFIPLKRDGAEAFRLARLIALLMRVHPAKTVDPETMMLVRLVDAGARSFAMHIRWQVINLVDRPQAYGRQPDLAIATTCLTWAELCVGVTNVAHALEVGMLEVERGDAGQVKRIFDAFYKLRGTDLAYPPRRM